VGTEWSLKSRTTVASGIPKEKYGFSEKNGYLLVSVDIIYISISSQKKGGTEL